MPQVRGSGKTESAAKRDAERQATAACGGAWQQEKSWSCHETSPGHWDCDLWYRCKKK